MAGIWRWRNSIESNEKDSAAAIAKTDIQNLHLVVKAICLPPAEIARLGGDVTETVRQNQMISMLVLARPQLLPRVNWIDLSLRMEIDPGNLARTSGDLLITEILESTSFKETVLDHTCSIMVFANFT